MSAEETMSTTNEHETATRRAVFERNGVLDIAVPYVRALRDGDGE
jgi:hypothetical protein